MQLHTHQMVMWPKLWKDLALALDLNWGLYPFRAESTALIPEEPGLYAFIVRPESRVTSPQRI
jgi:hypothetical protein